MRFQNTVSALYGGPLALPIRWRLTQLKRPEGGRSTVSVPPRRAVSTLCDLRDLCENLGRPSPPHPGPPTRQPQRHNQIIILPAAFPLNCKCTNSRANASPCLHPAAISNSPRSSLNCSFVTNSARGKLLALATCPEVIVYGNSAHPIPTSRIISTTGAPGPDSSTTNTHDAFNAVTCSTTCFTLKSAVEPDSPQLTARFTRISNCRAVHPLGENQLVSNRLQA